MKQSNWIKEVNLRPFLSEVAILCGYDFTEDDWNAVSYGLVGIDGARGDWYHYTFSGESTVKLAITQERGENVYSLQVELKESEVGAIEALFSVGQNYLLCRPD